MDSFLTTTAILPVFLGTPHKQDLLIIANIISGSIAIQYQVNTTWVTAETFTTSFVRSINTAGARVRVLVTGTVEYKVV